MEFLISPYLLQPKSHMNDTLEIARTENKKKKIQRISWDSTQSMSQITIINSNVMDPIPYTQRHTLQSNCVRLCMCAILWFHFISFNVQIIMRAFYVCVSCLKWVDACLYIYLCDAIYHSWFQFDTIMFTFGYIATILWWILFILLDFVYLIHHSDLHAALKYTKFYMHHDDTNVCEWPFFLFD